MDSESRMLAYIDEVIVGDRTSDAAEDSAGAAWAAFERGEFEVPASYKPGSNVRDLYTSNSNNSSSYSSNQSKAPKLNFDLFLKAMGALFLLLLTLTFILMLFGTFAD